MSKENCLETQKSNKQTNKNNYKHVCVEVKDKEMKGQLKTFALYCRAYKGRR